jgi:hypothetical protein
VPHGGFTPHAHPPSLAHAFEAGVVHGWHMRPPCPHCAAVGGVLHVLPAQQPLGHDAEVHLHWPCTHTCPEGHGTLVPHMQVPPAQVSAAAPQSVHAMPFGAHCKALVTTHVVPLTQQPLQPEVALQTHAPPTHFVPTAHGPPVEPQTHAPLAQVSAAPPMVQSWQVRPMVAHCVPLSVVWHRPFLQHPVAQLVALQPEHMPASVHVWLPGQVWQTLCWPHAPGLEPPSHVLPSPEQQPVHRLVSQTQAPITQRRPEPHEGPVPHLHAPPVHVSAPGPQGAQAWPAATHAEVDIGLHACVPSQQPEVHEVALHLQVPWSQYWPGSQGLPSPPQTQPTDGWQRLVSGRAAQLSQTSPNFAQRSSASAWQAPFRQQPDGQLVGVQPVQV